MITYRVYSIKSSGQIAGPPMLIEAESDREALRCAGGLVKGAALEIWQLSRLVGTIDAGQMAEVTDLTGNGRSLPIRPIPSRLG